MGVSRSETVVRYVATITGLPPRIVGAYASNPGTLVDVGSPFYAIVFAYSLPEARKIARSHRNKGGIWHGATRVTVSQETSEHNIPKLDPVAWQKREDEIAELNRRMGRVA